MSAASEQAACYAIIAGYMLLAVILVCAVMFLAYIVGVWVA